MTLYLEVFVFGALLGLPFLYESRPAFVYCLKFALYCLVVMTTSLILIPVFCFRPLSVLNLVLASYFCRGVTHLIGVKWEVRNKEHLEPQEACIIVSNHQSCLDVLGMFQIWSTMGKCTVIAKKELFWVWPFGLAAWLGGLVFIPRVKTKAQQAKAVIKHAVEKIAAEKTKLWIFPEGTRRNTGEIHPFKKGAFHSAISSQLPITPVVFSRYYFMDRGAMRFDQGHVIVQVLEPICTKGLTLDNVDELSDRVRQLMSETFRRINDEIAATGQVVSK
ncbi:1-acyl-sn-glycerol-3-phosphate acyltransferase alpha [Euwallacea similis]|uniref:1-acyl-sn-glycerol-3-phosphate acyltransferase alpha n=1 Tax=Euwallacea similis TaxID=1736056 RepID=UPI00344B5914